MMEVYEISYFRKHRLIGTFANNVFPHLLVFGLLASRGTNVRECSKMENIPKLPKKILAPSEMAI